MVIQITFNAASKSLASGDIKETVAMKRFGYLVLLMAFSPSAYAGDSFSFTIAGHRIHIEASRHCLSPSCVSVSIPGIYSSRRWDNRYRDRDDGIDTAADAAPAKPPVPAMEQVAARPAVPPVTKSVAEPVVSASPPPAIAPPAIAPPAVVPPKPPAMTSTTPVTTPTTPPIEIPTARVPPVTNAAPKLLKAVQKQDEPAEMPLGDWQTEGNTGSVRIQRCGPALCGYLLNPSTDTLGESVLINMKPKSADKWSGDIYSRASGSSYYATMTVKGPNTLRVEACALGQFFCSGNVWNRIAKPQDQMTSRQVSPEPKS
jgi:uncharacterized protein (DUF2147 family)